MSGKYLHLHLNFDCDAETDPHMLTCLLLLPVEMIENGDQNLIEFGSRLVVVGSGCYSTTLQQMSCSENLLFRLLFTSPLPTLLFPLLLFIL